MLSIVRYCLLNEDYDLIKKSNLKELENNINYSEIDSLNRYIHSNVSPQLVDKKLAKLLYDNKITGLYEQNTSDTGGPFITYMFE